MFLSDYLKQRFGSKVYKISLSTPCTCPNRDGFKGTGGCAFCSAGGSGEFSYGGEIKAQIEKAKSLVSSKFPKNAAEKKYIAYFQSFSNTYATEKVPVSLLKSIFYEAISDEEVVALSIGTRVDCVDDEILALLSELNKIKPVWVELGLQTIHNETLRRINSCFSIEDFENCVAKLKNAGLEIIVHLIFGLPGETAKMMEESVKFIASHQPEIDGIKLQNLQILKGSTLGEKYLSGQLHLVSEREKISENSCIIFSLEEYSCFLKKCLKILDEKIVIHRITGDGPKSLLLEPKWSADKKRTMNYLQKNKILS